MVDDNSYIQMLNNPAKKLIMIQDEMPDDNSSRNEKRNDRSSNFRQFFGEVSSINLIKIEEEMH